MPYTAVNHQGRLAIAAAWADDYDKPVRGRTVWVSGAPWDDGYAAHSVHAGATSQGQAQWSLETRMGGRLTFRTPAHGIYEEGTPIKSPRKVQGQARPWKYIAGKWDRFHQD